MKKQHPFPLTRERGSITVLNIFAIVACVALVLVTANIGNIWLKKSAAQDAADMLAPLLLENQFYYRGYSPIITTSALTTTLANDAKLTQSVGSGTIVQYTFGNSNGTTFTAIASSDPNPLDSTTPFNAIAVEVLTTPVNLGNLFGLSFGTVKGKAIAWRKVEKKASPSSTCLCNAYCLADPNFFCSMMCLMLSMFTLMTSILTLNGPAFLAALNCMYTLIDKIVLVLAPVTAWAWDTASVIISL